MGIDLYLTKDPCKTCGHQEEFESISCTYNLSPMWYAIYPESKGLLYIDGMTGAKAAKFLKETQKMLIERREEMINLEPPNGWGSYNGLLDCISELIAKSLAEPKLKWGSWR